jgi:hypothetical protein
MTITVVKMPERLREDAALLGTVAAASRGSACIVMSFGALADDVLRADFFVVEVLRFLASSFHPDASMPLEASCVSIKW